MAQLTEDRWFVTAMLAGFGTQVGLFSYLRRLQARPGAAGMAASTGTSTTAMLACCAHHLADVLPLLGLSAAAIFLDLCKTQLLWLGILMNLIGIGYLILLVRPQSPSNEGISPARHSHSQVLTKTMPSR